MTLDYHARIARDPRIAGGEATIKGTRVTLRTVPSPVWRKERRRRRSSRTSRRSPGRTSGQPSRSRRRPPRKTYPSPRRTRLEIKLDENLPTALVHLLTNLGHDVDTVPDEGVAGQDDTVVLRAAQDAGRFLITQDLDFSDARRSHPAPTMASCWFGYRNLAERRSRSEWSRSFEAKTSTPGLAVWSLQPCGRSG